MGKDDGMSKDELKREHARLVGQEQELKDMYQNAKAMFVKLEETYQMSKGTFSVQRYGQLKMMIKSVTREEYLKIFREAVAGKPASGAASERASLATLVQKAKSFSGEAQEQQVHEQEQATSNAKPSKGLGLFKKLKNITGFSNDPITDEDVMSKGELERDNSRKQRAVQRYSSQLAKAISKLESLQRSYEASKAHAPPKRYAELKDMIKVAVAEKLP